MNDYRNRGAMLQSRSFLKSFSGAAAGLALSRQVNASPDRIIMTVRGPVRSSEMGFTLSHEHILANFQPLADRQKHPWTYDLDEVVKVTRPYLDQIKKLGCRFFFYCTAVALG